MVLEIPITVAEVVGAEAIKDGTIAAIQEAGVVEPFRTTFREAARVTEEFRRQEFMHSFKEYMVNGQNGPYLTEKKECIIQKPEKALAELQELKGKPEFKGGLGEAIAATRDEGFGKVEEQILVEKVEGFDEASRVDRLTVLERPVKYSEVRYENGAVNLSDLYIGEGTKIATEVKNGGLSYLKSEAFGNMEKQIAAGLQKADHSMVEINQDCFLEMGKNPELAAKIIEHINDLNSKIILGLPYYNSQLEIFMGV